MKSIFLSSLLFFLFFSCKKESKPEGSFTVYKATGDIRPKMEEFRAALGLINITHGATTGRREINWDGVPDSLLNKPLPGNFFNPVGSGAPVALQRGLVYDDGEFEVSATNFSHLNSEAPGELPAFSGTKTFANVSRLEWPVGFEVAGEKTPASVKAFGLVITDIDVEGSVSVEFFAGDKSLGKFFPPAHDGSSAFSFFGVSFKNERVTKVMVHHQGALADGQKDVSQGGPKDLVVFDDLIYSEPVKL